MNQAWLASRRSTLVRDLVRDYCGAHALLTEQQGRFEQDGTVSYAVVNAMLGEAFSKGVLWRLKDTAHHLFRAHGARHCMASADGNAAAKAHTLCGELIDWCIGFAFHECIKLREDAYQRQHYANRLLHLKRQWHNAVKDAGNSAGSSWPLGGLPRQTADSMERELRRILRVLDTGLELLARYLGQERDNGPLARWLAVEDKHAASVFTSHWPLVLSAFEDRNGENLYSLAARDLIQAGRAEKAQELLQARRDSLGQAGLELSRKLEASENSSAQAAPASSGPQSPGAA